MKSINSFASALDALVEEKVRALATVATVSSSRWMRRSDSPLPIKSVRAAVRDGKITASRVGKVVMLDRAEHDAWIAEHRIGVTAANDAGETEDNDLAAAFGVVRRVAR